MIPTDIINAALGIGAGLLAVGLTFTLGWILRRYAHDQPVR